MRRNGRCCAVFRSAPKPSARAWIEAFMALHPCKCDDLKPAIVDYLLERSRP